jgi:hypothetical protein
MNVLALPPFRRTLRVALPLIASLVLATASTIEAQTPAATKDGKEAAAATPISPSPDDQKICESYIPVLTGKKKGSAILADPRLRAIATVSPDLVKCGAVAADSDEPCKLLSAVDADECRNLRFVLQQLRTNPKGRAFLMSDEDHANCRRELPKEKLPASLCDEFREAARAGDPSKCPKGDVKGMDGWCRAIITLDKSQCSGIGGIEDREQGKAACEKIVDRNKNFGKGLDEMAKSGTPLERALANAALGKADACKALEADAVKACLSQAEAAAIPVPKNDAPAAPAPDATPPKAS